MGAENGTDAPFQSSGLLEYLPKVCAEHRSFDFGAGYDEMSTPDEIDETG